MKNRYPERGFALTGLLGSLAFVLVGAGLLFVAIEYISDKPPEEKVVVSEEVPKSFEDTPVTDYEPYKDPYDISGEWLGDYIVTEPEECAGERGGWKATLTQSGDTFGGSYTSDAVSGLISGGAIMGSDVSWYVTDSGGSVSLSGTIGSTNTVEGTFIGIVCHEEFAPYRTKGTFFGGRLGSE